MLVLISDASVLIDIEHGQLTQTMFSLPYQFVVPDILFVEELAERHVHLLELGLVIRRMESELIASAYSLRQENSKTSVNDLLSLTLAKHENCQLLTGDKALRELAEQMKVEVHGTLWLVEKMLEHEKIGSELAQMAFLRMKEQGSRLPWEKVGEFLRKRLAVPIE